MINSAVVKNLSISKISRKYTQTYKNYSRQPAAKATRGDDLFGRHDGVDDGAHDERVDLDGRVQRDPAVVVDDLEVRLELEQRRDGAPVTEPGGHVQRRLAVHVLSVDERLVVAGGAAEPTDDRRRRLVARVRHGVVQRRPALLVGHVQLRAGSQQHVDDRDETFAGGQVKSRLPDGRRETVSKQVEFARSYLYRSCYQPQCKEIQ